jgi:hypothetical protein
MTNAARYAILATYDLPRIERELGEKYATLGDAHRAASEAFAALTADEKLADKIAAEKAIATIDAH